MRHLEDNSAHGLESDSLPFNVYVTSHEEVYLIFFFMFQRVSASLLTSEVLNPHHVNKAKISLINLLTFIICNYHDSHNMAGF